MKTAYEFNEAKLEKSKRRKKAVKIVPAAILARQYMELQRLRERISEAEAWRNGR